MSIKEKIGTACDNAEVKLQEWKDNKQIRAEKRKEWIDAHPLLSDVLAYTAIAGAYIGVIGGIIGLSIATSKNDDSSEEEKPVSNFDRFLDLANDLEIADGNTLSVDVNSSGLARIELRYDQTVNNDEEAE